MTFDGLNLILVLLGAFILGFAFALWWQRKRASGSRTQVNQDYFKGLNFVLNEQPDKAIEVFIKALEVDSETVELHLALGGLFRRKGQVDRATRIHQNLIARPNLTEPQRLQAIHELAQDYSKAGLLDRAENLYLELKESADYRAQSIEGLSDIYQKEKEWTKAIEVNRQHKKSERQKVTRRVAHFWCELAEAALEQQDLDKMSRCIKSAISEDKSVVRARILQGQLYYQQGKYASALKQWKELVSSSSQQFESVLPNLIDCFDKVGDVSGKEELVRNLPQTPKIQAVFDSWISQLHEMFGKQKTIRLVLEKASQEGLHAPVAKYLVDSRFSEELWVEHKALLNDLLVKAKSDVFEYTCAGCGFNTKAMHWHCVSCGEWDSFH